MSEAKTITGIKKKGEVRLAATRGTLDEGKWFVVDVKGKVLGRAAVQIAGKLIGKNKKTYVPHWDNGDHVVVLNAKDVLVTGRKVKDKVYSYYTGYQGGLKEYSLETLMEKKPTAALTKAVKGMLPKNKLGSRMLKRLLVYPDSAHKHQAQNPEIFEIK